MVSLCFCLQSTMARAVLLVLAALVYSAAAKPTDDGGSKKSTLVPVTTDFRNVLHNAGIVCYIY